jgi:RNA polymerase sigma factor (sigma-70 family)
MQENIRRAQAGDTKAWNVIYQAHYPWLFATALRTCGNTPDARQIVQETFVQAFLKIHQLKDPAAFSAWIKMILLRYAYRLSKNHEENKIIDLNDADIWEDEIARKLDRYGIRAKVHNSLSDLSEDLRAVALLRYFSGWKSYEQIASVLSIPIGTVRSRLHQVRNKLSIHWMTKSESGLALKQAEEWSNLYFNYFGNVHFSSTHREKLIGHMEKNLQVVFTSGKMAFGRSLIEQEIEDDLTYGNSFINLQVVSNDSISVVETHNSNSPEYPDRCPESTVLVLHRTKGKISRLHLHHSG